MNHANRMWTAALLAVAVGLAGCDRFRDKDTSAPRILRVMAYDNTNQTNPPVVAESPGSDATLSAVPLGLAGFRVDFSKPLDGSTVQKPLDLSAVDASPQLRLCRPADNIKVLKTVGGAQTDYTQNASVCYNPSGTDPNITIVPEGSATCTGANPANVSNGGAVPLDPDAVYVVQATDVADRDGHRLSFTLTVTTSGFIASDAVYPAQYGDPTGSATGLAYSSDPRQNYVAAPLAGATIPTGKVDAATALDVTPTAHVNVGRYSTAAGVLYGTPLAVNFTGGPMCPTTFEGYCLGGAAFNFRARTALDPAPGDLYHLAIGAQPVGAAYLGDDSNGLAQDVIPWLPLEDGQTYTLTMDPGITDVNEWIPASNGTGTTNTLTTTFATEAGTPRLVWRWPADGATGAYPTVDQLAVEEWTGQPLLGVAASTPLAAAGPVLSLVEKATGAPVPGVTQKLGEARGRSLTFAAADKLSLKNDTEYTMSWANLATAAGAPMNGASGSVTFRTLPFGQDPSYAGFTSRIVRYATTSSSARASNLKVGQGNVYPALAGKPIAYFTTATGKVAYDASAALFTYQPPGTTPGPNDTSSSRDRGFTFYALTGGGSVVLYEGKPEDNNPVTGQGGYARIGSGATPVEPWDDPQVAYPGSLLGFVPAAPLKTFQLYTLVATVVPLGGSATTTITLPFTTIPFRVALALDSGQLNDLSTTPVGITVGPTKPLLVRTTSVVDPTVFSTTPATDGPIRMLQGGQPVRVHLTRKTDGTRGTGEWINVVPDDTIVNDAVYTLAVTTDLKDIHGTAIQARVFTFTTASATSATGLVCTP